MTPGGNQLRVAVVGGGCAALTTAFELTRAEHRGRYAVTVYQMGSRLGGKGASGRGSSDRIEEHGLHLWMGFYENAFRLMRECYAELDRDPASCPIASWRDAFKPAPSVAVTDRSPHGDWEPWIAHFPPGEGLPGDPMGEQSPFSVRSYLLQAASLLFELLRSAHGQTSEVPGPDRSRHEAPRSGPHAVAAMVDAALRYGRLATAAALYEAVDVLRSAIEAIFPYPSREADDLVLRLVDAIAAESRRRLQTLVSGDGELRRTWQVIDLILAILRGGVRFGLAFDPRGFDAIDDYEWRDWLRLNGATEPSLDSGFVRGIYDLAFAFEDGDVNRPRLAASVAIRGAMRMFFTYRGALFWRMSAGMGDIVFAPLYEVLKRRGVRFEFFHRLRNVKLSPHDPARPPWVSALEFDVQARVVGDQEYQPLVMVHDLPCWPSKPDDAQLVDAEGLDLESPWEARIAAQKTLEVNRDFDLVVLGVSIAAIPLVGAELVERLPRWRTMVESVKTVATQAFQLWIQDDMRSLGWEHAPVNLSGFVEPFDTWADMGHLLPMESWRTPVRSLAYFCSALPDATPPGAGDEAQHDRQHARVRENAMRFMNDDLGALWPRAVSRSEGFRWNLLAVEPDDAGATPSGPERFDRQFWTANVRPSDRYVLSLPGTRRYRISPLDLSVDNLTIAGDWTETGLNTGCIESAVMSGMLAAHALSRFPRLEEIVGYDHP